MVNDMVIAKYIRLSSEDSDLDDSSKEESVSVTAQRQLITNYISEHSEFQGIPVKEFVDDGYSGTNFDRPAFIRMMDEAKQGKLSVIIVKDLSRFGRDHLGVGNYLERILPILQIRLIAVNDGYDSANLDGMTGGMSVALHNIINAMYSRDLSSKVKSAQRTRAEKGEYIASMPTFGYMKGSPDKHQLVVDEEAAAIVRLVFELVASGKPKGEIVSYLNENKIMTPAEYKEIHGIRKVSSSYNKIRLWNGCTINYMIRNETYLGITVWNKTGLTRVGSHSQVRKDKSQWIRVKGTHEPIVTQELFDLANAELEKNKRLRSNVRKPTTWKSLFICPYCQRGLRQTPKRKTYVCREANRSGIEECKTVRCEAKILEQAVMSMVNLMLELVDDNRARKKKENTADRISSRIKEIEGEQKRIKSEKLRLYTDFRSDRLTKEAYVKSYEEVSVKQSDLESELEQLKSDLDNETANHSKEAISNLEEVASLTEFDKAKLQMVIDRVIVYDEQHIEVVWKFEDFNKM